MKRFSNLCLVFVFLGLYIPIQEFASRLSNCETIPSKSTLARYRQDTYLSELELMSMLKVYTKDTKTNFCQRID